MPHLPVLTAIGSTPVRGEELTHRLGPPSVPSLPCTHCGHHTTLEGDNSRVPVRVHEQLPTVAGLTPPPTDPPVHPAADAPTLPARNTNNLCVVSINANNRRFHVLRLSPGPTAPPTPFDIILPPAATFFSGIDGLQAQYPVFTPATCGWHAVFECITQPALLWDCWGPGSLGEFPDVLTLWKSWDEGAAIARVGQMPALQLVDACWGCHKDVRLNKGHLPA